jgi:hypothetical protein
MRRLVREIGYDLREPGVHMIIIPSILLQYIFSTVAVQTRLYHADMNNVITLVIMELLIPFLGGYAAIMLMQGIFDPEGGELLYSYKKSNLYWGLIRQFRFFMLYALLVVIVCLCIAAIIHVEFSAILYITLAQSYAVMGVAFFGVALCKKIDVGIIILVSFVGMQIVLGCEFEMLNFIYSFSGRVLDPIQQSDLISKCLFIGSAGWFFGQVWVRK